MDKTRKYLAIAFITILIAVIIISVVGILLLEDKPTILQGQIETTEIRISGKLPGRIDTFLVKEGQNVKIGDTLVIINSPEALAKFEQVNAFENIAKFQNQKIDEGTRKQIVESMLQLWNKAKSDLQLAQTTYNRILSLHKDSVVTSQRKDEVEALYKAALAGERAAYQQYQLAVDGAQIQDRESARSLVNAAKGSVNEVQALLQDARLTAPNNGQISNIYPKRGELVGAGMPIMSLVVLDDAYVVLNVREDLLPHFKMNGVFNGSVPALGEESIKFKINYISPLGSYATWRSTKQTGSYDLRTFEIHAVPEPIIEGLRPGMSVLVNLNEQKNE
ncbi:HlyD family secretion protein [Coprobacter secundus]|uniref:HlyD family secretion protein n=1 Tax=Coprobacter secundus TaxID=1501392 RepID=UPI0035217CAD